MIGNEAKLIIKEKLTKNRYEHTIRVLTTALELGERYRAPMEKIELAAIFHDYSKNESEDDLIYAINEYHLPKKLLEYNKELWHGPVGAMKIQDLYNINDKEIIHAIYYHTTARVNMGIVEQIIFVADYIEPGRSFPGVDEVREIAKSNLDKAVHKALQNTIIFLMKRNENIYPDSFHAYNELTRRIRSGK